MIRRLIKDADVSALEGVCYIVILVSIMGIYVLLS